MAAEPWFQISLAEWSLHRTIRGGKLTNLDFPRVAKREFGIEGVEYVNQFFKDKGGDEKYFAELKSVCEGEGVKSDAALPPLPAHLEPARPFFDAVAEMVAAAVLRDLNAESERPGEAASHHEPD